jgi:hypothetical protein
MKISTLAVILVVVVGASFFWWRSRAAASGRAVPKEADTIAIDRIPALLAKLRLASATPAFAVLMFTTPERPSDSDAINVQFSMEHGRPGFEWVLLAPRNIEDKQRYLDFARRAGFAPKEMAMNGVSYLRVEDGDLARLCIDVITKMYGVSATKPVELLVEGFEWGP